MALRKKVSSKKKVQRSLGIIGSSQLAMYMAQAARQSGYLAYGMSDKKSDPATAWFTKWTKGKANKWQDINKISRVSTAVLFENKTHLNLEALEELNPEKFYPQLSINTKLNDLWTLKELFYDYDLPQTNYLKINGKDDLDLAFRFFNKKMVIKSRFSFKNKPDTFIIRNLAELNRFKLAHKGKESHFIVEGFSNFKSEHRIILARNQNNEIAAYPLLTLNLTGQNYNLVSTSALHKDFNPIIKKIKTLLTSINYIGVISFNLFNDKGRLYLNDADCRPCNTGMITLDGFNINQFELHIRAVLNLHLPEIIQYQKQLHCKYLIAGRRDQAALNRSMNEKAWNEQLSRFKNGKLYWYGKKEKRPNRKLGHINYTS